MTTQTKKTTIRLPPLLHHLHLHQTPHISNPCQVQWVILPLKRKVYWDWFANVGRSVRPSDCLSVRPTVCLSVRLSVGKTCCCSKIFMKTLLENLLLTLWMTSMQVKSLTAITGKRTCTTISGSSIACLVFFSLGCHEVCRTLYWFFSVKYHYRFNDNLYTEKHNFIGNNFMLQFTRANLVCSNIIFPQSLCL